MFFLGLDTDLSEIASMMTAPDPGAALGAKAVVAAGKNLLFSGSKAVRKVYKPVGCCVGESNAVIKRRQIERRECVCVWERCGKREKGKKKI